MWRVLLSLALLPALSLHASDQDRENTPLPSEFLSGQIKELPDPRPVSPSLQSFIKILSDCGIDSDHTVTVYVHDRAAAQPTISHYENLPLPVILMTKPQAEADDFEYPSVQITPKSRRPLGLHLRIGPRPDSNKMAGIFSDAQLIREREQMGQEILKGDFSRFIETPSAGPSIIIPVSLSAEAQDFVLRTPIHHVLLAANEDISLLARTGFFEAVSRASFHFKTAELAVRKIEGNVAYTATKNNVIYHLFPQINYSTEMNPLRFAAFFYHQHFLISSQIQNSEDARKFEHSSLFDGKTAPPPAFPVSLSELEWILQHETTAAHFRKDIEDFRAESDKINGKIRVLPAQSTPSSSLSPNFICQSLFGPLNLEGVIY